MIDLHVHTNYSFDSEVSIDEYCKRAIASGIKHICFTDHVDHNKNDYGYGYYNKENYFHDLRSARDRYYNDLNILSGIEFDGPHQYPRQFETFQKLPYDFILGSVHYWIGNLLPEQMLKEKLSLEFIYEKYWKEVHKLVQFGGFDSLAHFDFPKRYFNKCIFYEEQVLDILTLLIKNNIVLEINTSTLRKGIKGPMPDCDILNLYKKAGGSRVTFGSDAHATNHLGSGYGHVLDLIEKYCLENIIYIKRKPFELKSLDHDYIF